MKHYGVVIGFAILLTGPAVAQMKVLRLDYVVVSESENAQGQKERRVLTRTRFLSPDGRLREETLDPNLPPLHMADIHDNTRDVHVRLDLNRKAAIRRTGVLWQARNEARSTGASQQKQDLGTSLIQGFECQGTRIALGPGKEFETWKCQDPVSGQEFLGTTRVQLPGGKVWQEHLKKATRDFDVSPEIFEIPPDFRVADH